MLCALVAEHPAAHPLSAAAALATQHSVLVKLLVDLELLHVLLIVTVFPLQVLVTVVFGQPLLFLEYDAVVDVKLHELVPDVHVPACVDVKF